MDNFTKEQENNQQKLQDLSVVLNNLSPSFGGCFLTVMRSGIPAVILESFLRCLLLVVREGGNGNVRVIIKNGIIRLMDTEITGTLGVPILQEETIINGKKEEKTAIPA